MQAIAEPPAHVSMHAAGGRPSRDYPRLMDILVTLGTRAGHDELDGLLRSAIRRTCELLEIRRCGVYLHTREDELFSGCVAHPQVEIEAAVRRLKLGGPTDEITMEVVRTRRPVIIRDAAGDPRASRAAIRSWKVRSLLAVPMVSEGHLVGLMIFDNCERPHRYDNDDVEIACAVANAAAGAVIRGRADERLRGQLEIAARQNRLLRKTMTAEHRLSAAILSGGGLSAIVELVAELTGKPTALYDADGHPHANVHAEGEVGVSLLERVRGHVAVTATLNDAVAGSCVSVGPLLDAGVAHRHLVAPVDVRGERWGWLVLMEHPSRLGTFDDFLLRRAATHLALELAGSRRVWARTADARAQLARHLVRGTAAEDDVRRTSEYVGIDLSAPRVVVFLRQSEGATSSELDADSIAEHLRRLTRREVLATKGSQGVALLVDVPAGEARPVAVRSVKAAVAELLTGNAFGELIAGISSVCREPQRLPGAYREAHEVTRCIASFAGAAEHRVLAADDLGPGRLFVANADAAAVTRFVDDVIGRLLVDEEPIAELLRTLEAFFDTGRSVRLSSERLGVHENTVRYRLARVQAITGLDVAADADQQLSVQVALLVLRLQGHAALRPL